MKVVLPYVSTHGYASKENRCFGKQDWNAKGRVNAIGAIVGMSFNVKFVFG